MRLIVIRHAATDGNKTRYAGREDLPLNAAGREQAAALAAALASEPLDIIYSSPLQRALATAAPLAITRRLNVEVRDALTEIDFGRLQGQLKADHDFSLRRTYRDNPIPGGESLRDVWNRLAPVAEELTRAIGAGLSAAAVGHYWSNRLLVAMMSGQAFEAAAGKGRYRPENASAYALDYRNRHPDGVLALAGTAFLHAGA